MAISMRASTVPQYYNHKSDCSVQCANETRSSKTAVSVFVPTWRNMASTQCCPNCKLTRPECFVAIDNSCHDIPASHFLDHPWSNSTTPLSHSTPSTTDGVVASSHVNPYPSISPLCAIAEVTSATVQYQLMRKYSGWCTKLVSTMVTSPPPPW